MDLKVFSDSELISVARALRGVAMSDGAITAAEAAVIDGVGRIHGLQIDTAHLDPIEPAELARVLVDPHRRKRAVQLAIVMALVEGTPSDARMRAVQALARALETPDSGVDVLYELSHGHAMLARFDMARRVRDFMRAHKAFPGMIEFLKPIIGLREEPEIAARYIALGECAPGTFGRAIFDHYRDHHFAFPGEPRGLPEFGVFHDVGHVISGYGVDPQGEIRQAAFQAGFSRGDGFTFLLFGILQFHLGMRLTPVAKGEQGFFDVPSVLRAAERGAMCTTDLADFDVFENANVPLDVVRARLCVPALPVA